MFGTDVFTSIKLFEQLCHSSSSTVLKFISHLTLYSFLLLHEKCDAEDAQHKIRQIL